MDLFDFLRIKRTAFDRDHEEVHPDLILFEVVTLNDIDTNKFVYIIKNRRTNISNLVENYLMWYAMNTPNSTSLHITRTHNAMRYVADFLQREGVIEKWEGSSSNSRVLHLKNGSTIQFDRSDRLTEHTNRDFVGRRYNLLTIDEVDFDRNFNIYELTRTFDRMIIIEQPNDYALKFWEHDSLFKKIAISIGQNYIVGISHIGRDVYNEWLKIIRPFKRIEEEKNGIKKYDND